MLLSSATAWLWELWVTVTIVQSCYSMSRGHGVVKMWTGGRHQTTHTHSLSGPASSRCETSATVTDCYRYQDSSVSSLSESNWLCANRLVLWASTVTCEWYVSGAGGKVEGMSRSGERGLQKDLWALSENFDRSRSAYMPSRQLQSYSSVLLDTN